MLMSRISTTVLAGAITAVIALGAPQSAIAQSITCTPVQVADFPGSRIHILCAPGAGNIVYFALGVGDANEANRVLSLAASALVANRKLLIYFNPKPAEPEPNRQFGHIVSSAVRVILDDPPIHIHPDIPAARECKPNEPCGFTPFRLTHDSILGALPPVNFAHKLSRVSS